MKRLLKHPLVGRLKKVYRNACIAANYMAGIPDYDRYVAQQRKHDEKPICRLLPDKEQRQRPLLLRPL